MYNYVEVAGRTWGGMASCGGLATRLLALDELSRSRRHHSSERPIANRPQVNNLPHKKSSRRAKGQRDCSTRAVAACVQ
jgi:hypothetical protein